MSATALTDAIPADVAAAYPDALSITRLPDGRWHVELERYTVTVRDWAASCERVLDVLMAEVFADEREVSA